MADASANPANGYYSGRPLDYGQQAPQAVPAEPQATAGEQANALPASPEQPPENVTEQANHTRVHGIPGYYKGRVNNTNTAAGDQTSAAAPPPPAAPVAAAAVPAAIEPEGKLSWIDKCLMCFTGGGRITR